MAYKSTFTLLSVAALAAAQAYGPPPGPAGGASSSATPTTSSLALAPTAPADTPGFVNVDVAFNETFVFNPNNFNASNGTVVTFFFPNFGLTHSVTQSSFANPCTYLAANSTSGTSGGFDSGLQENLQFAINITNDQIPIWFHCKQLLHCGMGMVGAINAPASGTNTFSAFMSAAMAIGGNEVTETDQGPILEGVAATALGSPTDTAAAPSGTASSGSTSGAVSIFAGAGATLAAALLAAIVLV